MAVKIIPRSYLKFSTLFTAEGIDFWDLPEFPDLSPRQDDLTVEVTDITENRIDLIAFDVYGDVELWWVLALANNLELIPTQLRRGQKLRVPDPRFVLTRILG